MIRNSTLKLWDLLLKERYSKFDKLACSIFSHKKIAPKQETIKNILFYASSVRAIKTKSIDKVLISLN